MSKEPKRFRQAGVVVASMVMMVGVTRMVVAEGGWAQQQTKPTNAIPSYGTADANDPEHAKLHEQQVEAASNDRRKRVVADSARLLELAMELKKEVDTSTKDEMSVTAIRNAAEMEKLAHDLKERMKGN